MTRGSHLDYRSLTAGGCLFESGFICRPSPSSPVAVKYSKQARQPAEVSFSAGRNYGARCNLSSRYFFPLRRFRGRDPSHDARPRQDRAEAADTRDFTVSRERSGYCVVFPIEQNEETVSR